MEITTASQNEAQLEVSNEHKRMNEKKTFVRLFVIFFSRTNEHELQIYICGNLLLTGNFVTGNK